MKKLGAFILIQLASPNFVRTQTKSVNNQIKTRTVIFDRNIIEMYDSICRVCLKQSKAETMVPLSEKPAKRSYLTYSKALVKLAKISTEYNNILPNKVCLNCKKMIENMYSFTVMCQKNDRKLQKFVKLAQNDGEKCKAMICEFTLFCHYFPTYSKPQAKNHTPDSNPPISDNDDCDKDYNSSDNLENNPSDLQRGDFLLDSLENALTEMQTKPTNIKNIDALLDSIEQALNTRLKYRHIKTKIKDRPNIKYRNAKTKANHVKVKKTYQCKICNKILANQSTFKYHMQIHTNYKFICDQCGKGYPGKESLNRHLVTKHDKGSFIQCEQCAFKCPKRFELIEHTRIHTGERPFACDKCGLTFRRRALWRNHLLHHQEKTKMCDVCQKKFYTIGELHSHLNTTHERKFLYVCHICNSTFAKNCTVRKHLLVKHGVPREKQGKITRVTRDSNSSLFMENK